MAVVSAEFDKLKIDEIIAQGSLDFDDWTQLILYVEQIHHDDIEKITLVYDSFLSEFPLCYGYWKKYAEHNARLCNVEKAVQIFERAVESVPYSVGVWVAYCGFSVSSFEDPMEICRLFERGLSIVGKDYLCDILWDRYIEYEFSQQHWNSLANIYIRTLRFPSKKLHHYYESFKKLVSIWDEETGYHSNFSIEDQSLHEMDSETKSFKDTELCRVISDLLDPFTRSKALKKYISLGEQFYRISCDLDAKVQKFEQNIRRSYFHMKPLDDDQLQNWHQYLDLVEMESDFDWAVKLYERCVIACANYPEFWMRYVNYVESKGGKEIANDALERATNCILKNAPEIHLFNAWYKEKEHDVRGVRAAFLQCDQDSDSLFVDIIRRKANMEKRLGNHVTASDIYKEALDVATGKRPQTLPALYVHFARLQYTVSNGVEAAIQILLDGIKHAPLSKLLLKELILFALMHEGAIKVDALDSIVEKATTATSDVSSGLSTQDREELSSLYLELTDYQGTIHDVRSAWNRHLKLFPHLVRHQRSFKKPVKAGGLCMSFPPPQKPLSEDGGYCLIQKPSEEEKLLMGEKTDQSEQVNHVQAKLEDVSGSLNELEVGVLEATKKAKCGTTDSTDQAADDRDPMDFVKDSTSNDIHKEKPPSMDDESQVIIASPTSIQDISGNPPISHSVSPRDDNTAERYKESSVLSTKPSQKKSMLDTSTERPSDRDWKRHRPPPGKGRLESSSPRNSEERLERSSLSPKRQGGSREYFHDRRYSERSLSPRRYGGRRFSEDRWHRGERHDGRYHNQRHHQDNNYNNAQGRRDIRPQYQNKNRSEVNTVQTSNAQQQIASHQATQIPIQPMAFPQTQDQTNQYPPPSNEQYGNMQSNPLYNQMWQYYYYNQQQLLMQQQQQQPGQQQLVPGQQPMQNISQNPIQQGQAQQISPHNEEQQKLLLQYHQQFYQQQLSQQQQPTEQPPAQQQQVQVTAEQQVQGEDVNVQQQQQQQQAYEYQELQKQQYLLYLQQMQLYQHQYPQQFGGMPQDQHSSQQQQQLAGIGLGQPDENASLKHGDEKSMHQPDDGLSQPHGHYLKGPGVESTRNSASGGEVLAQPQDLPEIEGT